MDGAIVVLVSGSATGKGGAPLRWWALREALRHRAPCTIREVGCQRWQQCERRCQADGHPTGEVPPWYFDAMYCPARADKLAGEFRDAGVSTVVCSGLETHGYVVDLAARDQFTVVYDTHNVELPLHREIHAAAPPGSIYADRYTAAHLRMVEAAEGAAVAAADEVWTCTAQDGKLLRTTYPGTPPRKIRVVPNAVAVPDEMPAAGVERVSYTGRMDYFPNVDAGNTLARRIAPRLAELGHHLPVVIAGAGAAEEFSGRALAPNVRLVSNPDSVDQVIRGSVMAVPLRLGGGSRFKILEAFALGAPVVSTAKGVEGLQVLPGVHYLPAESPAEFATAIDRLVRDAALRDRLAAAAFAQTRRRYSVPALAEALSVESAGRRARRAPSGVLDAWSGLRPDRWLPGGHRNQVLLAHRGDRRLVVRRSARDEESLEWELDLLDHLAARGLSVPTLVPADDGRRHVSGVVVYEYVEGHEPRDAADWRRVVDALTAIHGATAGWPQRPGAATSRELLAGKPGGDVRLDLMPPRAVSAVSAAWRAILDAADDGKPPCAVHGDVAPANIRVGPDRVTLLDWDEARTDVPWFDFAFVPVEAEVASPVDRRLLHVAGVAWEAANCWASQPFYAHRRLAELYRCTGGDE